MDQARLERLREIIRILEPIQEEVHDIWLDQEGADQSEAIDYLSDAVDDIESAVTNLREAVGDDSSS